VFVSEKRVRELLKELEDKITKDVDKKFACLEDSISVATKTYLENVKRVHVNINEQTSFSKTLIESHHEETMEILDNLKKLVHNLAPKRGKR